MDKVLQILDMFDILLLNLFSSLKSIAWWEWEFGVKDW